MCERNNWDYLKLKESVLKKYRNRCANCGSKEDLEIHHIVPISLGGTNNATNLVPLCYSCHKAAHNGRHKSKFMKNFNNPQPRHSDEEAYAVFDDFMTGNIGRAELKERMGFSKSYNQTASPQFKKYLEEKGIEFYRNNIDTMIYRNYSLHPGTHVGYVVYKNGIKESMIYQKDKVVEEEPTEMNELEKPEDVKKEPSVEDLYEAYLTGAMGFSEADYRISRIDKYSPDDFRTSMRFQHYLRNHEIAEYQNNVDMIIRVRGDVKVGDEVGYLLYTYGLRVPLIH